MVNFAHAFVVGSVLQSTFELYLRLRRARKLREPDVPRELKGEEGIEETFRKSREYQRDLNNFGAISETCSIFTGLLTLYYSPFFWGVALRAIVAAGLDDTHEVAHMAVFCLIGTLVEQPFSLPFALYRTFVIEERYGFNKFTAGKYFSDWWKQTLLLGWLLGVVMFAPMIWLIGWAGPRAWLPLWVFISLFVLFFQLVYPPFIAPLFNTFKPLEEGTTRDAILALIGTTGLSCERVYEVDGSRQSAHSNAYVAGLCCSKRIVIYDTLLNDLESDVPQICSVVAHEIGHAMLHHTWALLAVTQVQFFVMFYTFGFFAETPAVVTDFGYEKPCAFLAVNCFFTVYTGLVSPLIEVAMHAMQRYCEYEADAYSVRLGYDLRPALTKMAKKNLGDLNPDWLHSLYHHSHPSLLERCRAIATLRGEASKEGKAE